MLHSYEIPYIVEGSILAILGVFAMFWAMRVSRKRKESIGYHSYIMHSLVTFQCFVTLVLIGSMFLNQGFTIRDDAIAVRWSRWVQFAITCALADIVIASEYLCVSWHRIVAITAAALSSWFFGVMSIISSGTNFYYWFAFGVVTILFIMLASIRKFSDMPSMRFWMIPVLKAFIESLIWLNLILSPSVESIFSHVLTEWFYSGLNVIFICFTAYTAISFVSARKSVQKMANIVERKVTINKNGKRSELDVLTRRS